MAANGMNSQSFDYGASATQFWKFFRGGVRSREDFSAIPLGARPPYLAISRHKDCPIDYLFRHKTNLEIGLLLQVGSGLYYFAPPTLLSRDQNQEHPVQRILALNGWQAVCEQLELLGYDGMIFTLTGSDDE